MTTIEDIRAAWHRFYNVAGAPDRRTRLDAEFDRALAEHDRQEREKAWDACVASMDAAYSDDNIPWPSVNPHRKQEPNVVRIGTDCAWQHNGDPYACTSCDWTSRRAGGPDA